MKKVLGIKLLCSFRVLSFKDRKSTILSLIVSQEEIRLKFLMVQLICFSVQVEQHLVQVKWIVGVELAKEITIIACTIKESLKRCVSVKSTD